MLEFEIEFNNELIGSSKSCSFSFLISMQWILVDLYDTQTGHWSEMQYH